MNDVPSVFRARINSHNRHCWIAAVLSLLAAVLLWMIFAALFTSVALVFETVRTGDTGMLHPPAWFYRLGAGVVVFLFAWAALDRWITRYRLPPDRPVIGWHLFRDVLLLPARTTFAIWDYFSSRITLTESEREDAWNLLQVIAELRRARRSALTYHVPEPRDLDKLLLALQFTDWIDLHRGDEDWYYIVRSDQQDVFKTMLPAA